MNIVSPEFTSLVETLFSQLKLEDCIEAEELRLAKEFGALPIGYDLTAFIFLKPDGEVIWSDFIVNEIGRENDKQTLIRVIVNASRRYPELEKFIPNRPENAEICIVCKGTKFWLEDTLTKQPAKCVICAGLGWTIVEQPKC